MENPVRMRLPTLQRRTHKAVYIYVIFSEFRQLRKWGSNSI